MKTDTHQNEKAASKLFFSQRREGKIIHYWLFLDNNEHQPSYFHYFSKSVIARNFSWYDGLTKSNCCGKNHVTCYSEASEHTLSVPLVSIQNHRQQLSVSKKYQATIWIGEKERKRKRMTFLKPLTLPHCQDISNIDSVPFILSSLITS